MSSAQGYEGHVSPGFERVAGLFAQLMRAPGRGGGSYHVRIRDRVVVDIWAGVADPSTGRPWTRDSLGLAFSTSKGVAATIVHRLADRGLISYDEPVAAYWKAFAAGGKGRITVRQLLSHQAGMDSLKPLKRIDDHLAIEEQLAAYRPEHAPGTPAYHSLTYGWLLAGLARAVTGKGLEDLLQSEINELLGIDGLHFGRPRSRAERVSAFVGTLGPALAVAPVLHALLPPAVPGSRMLRSIFHPDLEAALSGEAPAILDAVMPAVNGMFSAASLATMYAALANRGSIGGRRLLSPETVRAATRIQTRAIDRNMLIAPQWRLGYHQLFAFPWLPRAFGHFGYAGSGGWADPTSGMAAAFMSNRIYPVQAPFGDLALYKLSGATIRAARRAGTGLAAVA